MLNVCRLCLHKGETHQFRSLLHDSSSDIIENIKKYLSIEVRKVDSLPTALCLKCTHQLNQWIAFYDSCHSTQEILKQVYDHSENGVNNDVNNVLIELKEEVTTFSDSTTIIQVADERGTRKVASVQTINDSDTIPSVSDIGKSVYECEICLDTFTSCLEYLDHLPAHDGQAVFNCDDCREVFQSRMDLIKHEKSHRIVCTVCHKLLNKSSMKLHMIMHEGRHKCPECLQTFNSKSALQQHTNSVHKNLRNYVCDACGQKLSSVTALRVHQRTHSNIRPYGCTQCTYQARTSAALWAHKAKHSDECHVCKVCSKKFRSVRYLNEHKRRVHSTEKRHKCGHCEMAFVDNHRLTVHLRTHTNARLYKCRICCKGFARSDGLKEHFVTHNDRDGYVCGGCFKWFQSKRGILKHRCCM